MRLVELLGSSQLGVHVLMHRVEVIQPVPNRPLHAEVKCATIPMPPVVTVTVLVDDLVVLVLRKALPMHDMLHHSLPLIA